jgi:hypothetical protein
MTLTIYNAIIRCTHVPRSVTDQSIWVFFLLLLSCGRYNACGIVAGKLFCIIALLDYLIYRLLEWLSPRDQIDIAPNFPYELYSLTKDKL